MAARFAAATFERIVDEHRTHVLRVCGAILRDPHLAADAAQETFLRLWTRGTEGRLPRQCGAWLRSVAVSTALDIARARKSRSRTEELAQYERGEQASESDSPQERKVVAQELRERLEAALSMLPEGQRSVFVLRHDVGLSLAEVAQTLGVALPTAKTQFARACVRLQSHLAACDPERGLS